jgi:hypothetical protein
VRVRVPDRRQRHRTGFRPHAMNERWGMTIV